jgi:hypothetical protein
LKLLHDDELIFKTKGPVGQNQGSCIYIDLKAYRLLHKLEQVFHSTKGAKAARSVVVRKFPQARESEYGFTAENSHSDTPDLASHINSTISPDVVDRVNTVSQSIDQEITGQISVLEVKKEAGCASQLPFSKRPGKQSELKKPTHVEHRLSPKDQEIIEFIQTRDVFLDESGEKAPLLHLNSQEISSLKRCKGLTLDFLRRYHALPSTDKCWDEWLQKCTLGFFCDHFWFIQKRFDKLEADTKLESMRPVIWNKTLINADAAACNFINDLKWGYYCRENDPAHYRDSMRLADHFHDGGKESALAVLWASLLPDIAPDDKAAIIAEHRPLARSWFMNNPLVYFGLKEAGPEVRWMLNLDAGVSGVDIAAALQFGEKEEKAVHATLTTWYVGTRAYIDRYSQQRSRAMEDLCACGDYEKNWSLAGCE